MTVSRVGYAVDDRIARITLDSPNGMNTLTIAGVEELLVALDRAERDDDVRVIVVTGAGRVFCAGADLSGGEETFVEGGGGDREGPERVARDGGGQLTLRLFDCIKPIVAAVNGAAVGLGATMILPMDVRIAAAEAKFGYVFARRGIVPDGCSSWFLPRVVGISRATDWMLSGRFVTASEALAAGLVNDVVPRDAVVERAESWARELASNTAPVSVALTRRLLWRMLGYPHPMDAHRAESRGLVERGASLDAAEGIRAFLEKRRPDFPVTLSHGVPDVFPEWREPLFR